MAGSLDRLTKTILSYLRQRGELAALPSLVEALQHTSEYRRSVNQVMVTSAHPLSAADLKKLESFIRARVSGPYALRQAVDSSLLAGFTLQVNDAFLDASVLGKINALQNKLTAKEQL